MFDTILAIDRDGTATPMVEQNAKKALSIPHQVSCWNWAEIASMVPAGSC